MSLQILSFSSIINTFSALRVALTIGKCHFARFCNRHVPTWLLQIWVWLVKFYVQIIEVQITEDAL